MKKYLGFSGLMLLSGFFCVCVFMMGCGGSETEVKPKLKTGAYDYTLTDSAGTSLVTGVLTVATVKRSAVGEDKNNYDITGTYTVVNMTTDTSYYGFATMKGGDFKGLYNHLQKSIWVNTNPMIADANVFLNGTVAGTNWSGSWNFSTFRGAKQEAGYFTANHRIK